jgi:hypothetical protein
MKDLIRRSTVHFDVDGSLHLAEKLIAQAAAPPASTSRWTSVFDEARGDLAAAEARGQDVGNELRLLGALIQWRLERLEEQRAVAPITAEDFPCTTCNGEGRVDLDVNWHGPPGVERHHWMPCPECS